MALFENFEKFDLEHETSNFYARNCFAIDGAVEKCKQIHQKVDGASQNLEI